MQRRVIKPFNKTTQIRKRLLCGCVNEPWGKTAVLTEEVNESELLVEGHSTAILRQSQWCRGGKKGALHIFMIVLGSTSPRWGEGALDVMIKLYLTHEREALV